MNTMLLIIKLITKTDSVSAAVNNNKNELIGIKEAWKTSAEYYCSLASSPIIFVFVPNLSHASLIGLKQLKGVIR